MSSIREDTLYDIFRITNLPIFYGSAEPGTALPYLVYVGEGQETFKADNTFYFKQDSFRLEYYYTEKNVLMENEIETALLDSGYLYEKSEDIYIEDERVFAIYYYV